MSADVEGVESILNDEQGAVEPQSLSSFFLTTIMTNNQFNDNPPSYDSVAEGFDNKSQDAKHPLVEAKHPLAEALPNPSSVAPGPSSYSVHPATAIGPSPILYNYRDPLTQETVASLLPPDHPEMICLQSGEHITESHFGLLGILAAVFWFPLGVGLCLLDRKVKCRRCGVVIDGGMCS
ncbi:hypothetical protein D9757_006116 [Collybiopsis confluens]|uniref:Brain protein I3 n=1 Tax=Collybiopsis confluens TaxID=2823264 RepID=A0A8H5HHP9_9AGAR|nr:hypothetical protein D9757_006116 [Collybiopsis confluens]